MNTLATPDTPAGPVVETHEAIVIPEIEPEYDPLLRPRAPAQVKLLTANGRYTGTFWPTDFVPTAQNSPYLYKADVNLIHCGNGQAHVLRVWANGAIDPLALVQPEDCPVPATLDDLQAFHAWLEVPELKQFVADVFSLRRIFEGFWAAPASLRHHHAWPGGLAWHTVDVLAHALDVLRHPEEGQCEFDRTEIELGAVAALGHDMGKVASYTRSGYLTSRSHTLGHELLGIELLQPALLALRQRRTKLYDALTALLLRRTRYTSSEWRLHAVNEVVSAADRKSAAADTRPAQGS